MKRFKDLTPGARFGWGCATLVLLVAPAVLIDWIGLPYWLWLAWVPCIVMLVILVLTPAAIDIRPSTLVEPPAEVACLEPEPLHNSSIEAKHNASRTQDFAQLADKMQHLADLTTHMLERSQALTHAVVDSPLAINDTTLDSQYLSLVVDGTAFAVSMLNVHTLMEATQLMPRPGQSLPARRAIRLGSSLVPVIDLGLHFGGRPVKIGASTHIIIVEVPVGDHWQRVGLVPDAVGRILDIPWGQIEAPATSGAGFILGTTLVSSHRVMLLDIERLLLASGSVGLRTQPRPVEQQEVPT
ncbi:chemotaxis protein CheW [Pseudomonas citri]|uniref:chemotaxis protein CheW n=1 Tax=Pseudomonas citri TaxID=2978349 RepID=UPI0021B69E9C|nr:chemotaxis protein CheW [Pseudomonas citri]